MNPNTFPTKGNLILAKNSLALATQGYGLKVKKRNILLRELMGLIDQAKAIQSEIDSTLRRLQGTPEANIEMGITMWRRSQVHFPSRMISGSRRAGTWERRSRLSSIHRQKK